MTDTDRPSARFFILGGCGFARFQLFSAGDDLTNYGEFHVRGSRENSWVLAGVVDLAKIGEDLASGRLIEFSPASLMGSVPSPRKSHAARVNGSKGGRPRKS
jgi:hypothetical protein